MVPVLRVRECDLCGAVGGLMDTVCPRCKRHGTLRDRLQCSRCKRMLEDTTCWDCAQSESVRVGTAEVPAADHVPALDVPDVSDPLAVAPPWVAAAVGGAVVGTVVGVAGAWFQGIDPALGGVIGLACGIILGAALGGGTASRRR